MLIIIEISEKTYNRLVAGLLGGYDDEFMSAIRNGKIIKGGEYMTRFSNFTDEELDAMESAFCNEGLGFLVDEIRTERRLRENRR